MTYGIDISKYQGLVDFEKARADGVQFVMIRILGNNIEGPYIDPRFEYNYAECRRLNIPCGGYWYTCARTRAEADKELALVKEAIRGKSFTYPLALDMEDNSLVPLGTKALTDLALYELETAEGWDRYVCLYSYTYFENSCLDMSRLAAFDNWVADYRGHRPAIAHGMWQYSSTGLINGITGNVDLDYAYKDYPAIITGAGLDGAPDDEDDEDEASAETPDGGSSNETAAALVTRTTGPMSAGDLSSAGTADVGSTGETAVQLVTRTIGPMSAGDDRTVCALAASLGLGIQ